MPSKVFISYRREDSKYQARRIYDAFVQALPSDSVFMDVDSIRPGADFVEILEGWVQQCDVLLALIGPNWSNSIDPKTNLRRLDNPEDLVRIEVRGALERTIPVVPVLLDATEMPTADDLPDDIKALRRRHAEYVDFRTFDPDVERLIKRLKIGKQIELPSEAPASQAAGAGSHIADMPGVGTLLERSKPDPWPAKPRLLAAAAALLAAATIYLVMGNGPRVDVSTGPADFAKLQEAQRYAEARASDAEARVASVLAARAKAEEGQRTAEKARQDAEAKVAALAKKNDELALYFTPITPPGFLLTDISGRVRWTSATASCARDPKYTAAVFAGDAITWISSYGNVNVEEIVSSEKNQILTTTRMSRHAVSETGFKPGTSWTYSRLGDQLRVQNNLGLDFTLKPCP